MGWNKCDARGTCKINSQVKFKTSILNLSLYDYGDANILASGTTTVAEVAVGRGNNSVEVVFKNCTPCTHCISKINNTQKGNAKNIDIVMPIYNLIQQ